MQHEDMHAHYVQVGHSYPGEAVMRVYHRTSGEAAAAIKEAGFRDAEGTYLTRNVYRGVWFADQPLDINEGADGEVVFEVEVPEPALSEYEWIEEGKPYREFLVPAEVVNRWRVVEVTYDEEWL